MNIYDTDPSLNALDCQHQEILYCRQIPLLNIAEQNKNESCYNHLKKNDIKRDALNGVEIKNI